MVRSREVRRSQGGHLGRTYRGRLGAKVWPGSHRHISGTRGLSVNKKVGRYGMMAVLDQLGLLKVGECGAKLGLMLLEEGDRVDMSWLFDCGVMMVSACLSMILMFFPFKMLFDDYITCHMFGWEKDGTRSQVKLMHLLLILALIRCGSSQESVGPRASLWRYCHLSWPQEHRPLAHQSKLPSSYSCVFNFPIFVGKLLKKVDNKWVRKFWKKRYQKKGGQKHQKKQLIYRLPLTAPVNQGVAKQCHATRR